MPEEVVTISKALDAALHELWEAADEWAGTESDRDNTPEEERILTALRSLRAVIRQ